MEGVKHFGIIDPDESSRPGGSPWRALGTDESDEWELTPGVVCRDGAVTGRPGGPLVIAMDPRHAFGNGRHPTTRLCARYLAAHLAPLTGAARAELRLLDAGTGTGILAIMAALLGLRHITAVDNNPHAIESALANRTLNGCGWIDLRQGDIASIAAAGPYDLVAANLVSDVLLENLPTLRDLTRPGGTILASGVSGGSHERVTAAFHDAGLRIRDRAWLDGWWGYVLEG